MKPTKSISWFTRFAKATARKTGQPIAFMMAVAITGQNPASSEPAAKALLEKLA